MSVPLEPGWLTLTWAVNPKAALGLILGQSCLPRHHPVTWQEHSQGLGRGHTVYTTDKSPAVCGQLQTLEQTLVPKPSEQSPRGSLIHPGTGQDPHMPELLVTGLPTADPTVNFMISNSKD